MPDRLQSNLTVTLSSEDLRALGATTTGPLYQFFLRTGAKIDAKAKQKLSNDMLHVRTGNLRSSQAFHVEVQGDMLTLVNENTASYAEALHNGSRPHEIRARRSNYLTGWSYGGAPVFTPLVHHPGTKAKPWLTDSMREVMASQLT